MKTIKVQLSSLSPIMFNAFRGQEEIPPERKLHLSTADGRTVILPASYIMGFLTATTVGRSCINTFVVPKERQDKRAEVLSHVACGPVEIPMLDGNAPILFEGFNGKVYLDERGAQASKTCRVLARRPVVGQPWSVEFDLFLDETEYLSETRMRDWFSDGGTQVAMGAFRPFFGRFEVASWK